VGTLRVSQLQTPHSQPLQLAISQGYANKSFQPLEVEHSLSI
jgi:hypothetical protein